MQPSNYMRRFYATGDRSIWGPGFGSVRGWVEGSGVGFGAGSKGDGWSGAGCGIEGVGTTGLGSGCGINCG